MPFKDRCVLGVRMFTYIMQMPVMRSFLCDRTVAVHRPSIQTVTLNTPQHREKDFLPNPYDFASFNLTYSFCLFCITFIHFTYTKEPWKSNFASGNTGFSKALVFPKECTGSVTFHRFTHEECFWKTSSPKCCFQMTINFCVTSALYPSKNADYFHFKQAEN